MSENTPNRRSSPDGGDVDRWDTEATDGVITAVVEVAALIHGCSPFDLEPLSKTLDTDALEAITRTGDGNCVVRFRYEGLDVRVDGAGRVSVAR